jgi:hypothetical protein
MLDLLGIALARQAHALLAQQMPFALAALLHSPQPTAHLVFLSASQ